MVAEVHVGGQLANEDGVIVGQVRLRLTDRAMLLGPEGARALARLLSDWADTAENMAAEANSDTELGRLVLTPVEGSA